MTPKISVDPEVLRADVRDKYKEVATNPRARSTSIRVDPSPHSSATTRWSSTHFPIGLSNPLPGWAIPTRSAPLSPESTSSISARVEDSTASLLHAK